MEKENVISVLLPSFLVIGSPCRTLAGHTDGGVGIMVRDSNGNFVAGRALYVDNVFSALQIVIVSTIRSPSVDRSPIGPVVEDTKTLLTHITRDGFTHIRRVANGAAHRLAWYASHIGTTTTWFEEPPDLPILSFS
ncbi:unnamed protein product [Prunus armeniaca]